LHLQHFFAQRHVSTPISLFEFEVESFVLCVTIRGIINLERNSVPNYKAASFQVNQPTVAFPHEYDDNPTLGSGASTPDKQSQLQLLRPQ
jgi:hypothetical protein